MERFLVDPGHPNALHVRLKRLRHVGREEHKLGRLQRLASLLAYHLVELLDLLNDLDSIFLRHLEVKKHQFDRTGVVRCGFQDLSDSVNRVLPIGQELSLRCQIQVFYLVLYHLKVDQLILRNENLALANLKRRVRYLFLCDPPAAVLRVVNSFTVKLLPTSQLLIENLVFQGVDRVCRVR